MNIPLEWGRSVVVVDSRGRRHLVLLEESGEFHTHLGVVSHDAIRRAGDGGRVESTHGARYEVFTPTLEEVVVEMPRGAQVIYPKDLATMCMIGDVHAGCRVFESGVGSGALSMALLRTGATVLGLEIREDFATRARRNVERFVGRDALERYSVMLGDATVPFDLGVFDRAMLDLPEPWNVVPQLRDAIRPGGILVAYTPSITQAVQLREALLSGWADQRTIEVLHRGWNIEGRSVRPDHRMVAHTAFLTVARRRSERTES